MAVLDRSPPADRPAGRALAGGVVLAAVALGGCGGGLFHPFEAGPAGLHREEAALRSFLVAGRYDSALARLGPEGSTVGDELLRLQHRGLVAHYAGRYGESNDALERAAALAEDRYTKSVSRAALSLLTNDRVLPYDPPRSERLLIHYYGALNYLLLEEPEEAAVEARRLSRLLDRYEDEGGGRGGAGAEGRLGAALRYFAGAVFEAAGEANDARVAYRLAGRAGALPEVVDASPGAGEVVVVLERGFVAHRVERSATLLLSHRELERLLPGGGDDGWEGLRDDGWEAPPTAAGTEKNGFRGGWGEGRPLDPADAAEEEEAFEAAVRMARAVLEGGEGGRGATGAVHWSGVGRAVRRSAGELPYLLRIAWPAYAREGGSWGGWILHRTGDPLPGARAPATGTALAATGVAAAAAAGRPIVDGAVSLADGSAPSAAAVRWIGDVSEAVVEEYAAQEPLVLAKSIVRAAAKLAVARELEDEVGERSEVLGEVAGVAANAAAVLLERADTRCWHLVPGEIGFARLRLPAGKRVLSLRVPGGTGPGRVAVDVRPGRVAVVSARVW